MAALRFTKGHGTANDFVIVADPDAELLLDGATVAAICDRRRGVGGDGLLRVVRVAAHPEVAGRDGEAEWFMDYRNADGSLAQMCGNGARVFARYLVESGLAQGPSVVILTRSGTVVAHVEPEVVTVELARPVVGAAAKVRIGAQSFAGTSAVCGNPNLVCHVAGESALDPAVLDLFERPEFDPHDFPDGANVEFVAVLASLPSGELAVRMRVVERGVGETHSCGSGACAVAAVVLAESGQADGVVRVGVPGGQLTVTLTGGRCLLAGPAVLVASGTLDLDSLELGSLDLGSLDLDSVSSGSRGLRLR